MIDKVMVRAQRRTRKLKEAGRLAPYRHWHFHMQSDAPFSGLLNDIDFVRSRKAVPSVILQSLKTNLWAAELAMCPF